MHATATSVVQLVRGPSRTVCAHPSLNRTSDILAHSAVVEAQEDYNPQGFVQTIGFTMLERNGARGCEICIAGELPFPLLSFHMFLTKVHWQRIIRHFELGRSLLQSDGQMSC